MRKSVKGAEYRRYGIVYGERYWSGARSSIVAPVIAHGGVVSTSIINALLLVACCTGSRWLRKGAETVSMWPSWYSLVIVKRSVIRRGQLLVMPDCQCCTGSRRPESTTPNLLHSEHIEIYSSPRATSLLEAVRCHTCREASSWTGVALGAVYITRVYLTRAGQHTTDRAGA